MLKKKKSIEKLRRLDFTKYHRNITVIMILMTGEKDDNHT